MPNPKFCPQCGTPNEREAEFCANPDCGKALPVIPAEVSPQNSIQEPTASHAVVAPPVVTHYQQASTPSFTRRQTDQLIAQEQYEVDVPGYKSIALGIRIVCVALLLFGLLPFASVSCSGQKENFSAYKLGTLFLSSSGEYSNYTGNSNASLWAGILALGGVAAGVFVGVSCLKIQSDSDNLTQSFSKEGSASVKGGFAGIAALIVFALLFKSQYPSQASFQSGGLSGALEIGYWLSLLALAGLFLGGLLLRGSESAFDKNNAPDPQPPITS